MAKQLVLKKTGERVSILGSIAKIPDAYEWRVTGTQQSGRHVTPRATERRDLKRGYQRVIIHHATHNEVAVVNPEALAMVPVK